jgi:hypothetical protein
MNIIGHKELLGEYITNFNNVIVVDGDGTYCTAGNIVIETNKKQVQLIVSQTAIEFILLSNNDKLRIDGEYENIQNISIKKMEVKTQDYKIINSIVEIWSGNRNDGYIFMMGFFDSEEGFIVALCFGTDEVEIIESLDIFWKTINQYGKYDEITLFSNRKK